MSKRLYGNAISTLVLLATVAIASAQSSLHNLDIRVVLSKNGDARITETRQMTVGSKGTECYIVIENIGACDIKDLCVMDETGHQFEKALIGTLTRVVTIRLASVASWRKAMAMNCVGALVLRANGLTPLHIPSPIC